jgi:hypothetical protein
MNGADFGGYRMGLILTLIIQLGWLFRFSRLWTIGVPNGPTTIGVVATMGGSIQLDCWVGYTGWHLA